MKKLKVSPLENAEAEEIKIVEFLKKLDLESISTLYIATQEVKQFDTYFYFKTEEGQGIRFYYEKNQKVCRISVFEDEKFYLSKFLIKDEEELKEKWLHDIWDQFADYFNLRIRLMFINETTPWKWETTFTY